MTSNLFRLLSAVLFLCPVGTLLFAQPLPTIDHSIGRTAAEQYIDSFRTSPAAPLLGVRGGAFGRAIVDSILAQPGCRGVRIYHARTPDGTPAFVLVGVDSAGADMSAGRIGQASFPCPPYCSPQPASLVKEP